MSYIHQEEHPSLVYRIEQLENKYESVKQKIQKLF